MASDASRSADKRSATQYFWHEMGNMAWTRQLVFLGILTVICGFAAPFGTDIYSFWPRLGFWGLAFYGVSLISMGTISFVKAVRRRLGILEIVSGSLLAWLPGVGFVGSVRILFGDTLPLAEWLSLTLKVGLLVPCMMLASVSWVHGVPLRAKAERKNRGETEKEYGALADALLEALPENQRGCVWALKGEDHYMRIFTENGEGLVFSRLRDGVAAFGEHRGVWVHRSFWVAREAITEHRREGRRMHLSLRNGLVVPVARARQKMVCQAISSRSPTD